MCECQPFGLWWVFTEPLMTILMIKLKIWLHWQKIDKDVFSDDTLCIRMIVRNFTRAHSSPKVGKSQFFYNHSNKLIIWIPRLKIEIDVFSDETFCIRIILRNFMSLKSKGLAFTRHLTIILMIKLTIWLSWQKIQKDIFSEEALCVRLVVRSFMMTNPSPKNWYLQNNLRSFLPLNLQFDFLDWKYRKMHFLTRPAA